ncbi:MAG: O-antigen ligase family protein [Nitrospirae bacterium]|nr:O-antigen ligase family protein [Nitrospirota bacterium]
MPGNARQWLYYGLIGFLSGILSPDPLGASYWATAYLAAFTALKVNLREKDLLDRSLKFNYITWFITVVFLSILVFVSRESLFVTTDTGLTGYGISGRVPTVAQMPMSRSSGMARFAAIPGIISFVFFWRAPKWQRLGWGVLFFYSSVLIYLMQSRGAIVSFAFALAFVMLFLGKWTRRIGLLLMFIFGMSLFADIFPQEIVDQVSAHLERHQSREELLSLTGRTLAWEHGWVEIMKSPLIGWGFQADRYLLAGEHVHNTYLYALLTSGFLGTAAFIIGLGWTWRMFYLTLKKGIADKLGHRVPFILCGGILMFFTVRSIPEVSGALFSVDYMLMLPVLVYIGILYQQEDRPRNLMKIKIKW